MIDVLLIARAHLLTAVRERVTLFWFLVFPVFLLVILSLVFGGLAEEGKISFTVSLVNFDGESESPFAATIEGVFENLSESVDPDEEPLFNLVRPDTSDELEAFLDDEILALRRGRRAAVIAIPAGYGRAIERRLVTGRGDGGPDDPALAVYRSEGNASSDMAIQLVEQVLAGVDREILTRTARFDPAASIPRETTWVGSAEGQTRYIDYLLPGILLMGFFVNGLFGIPGAILFSREQRILRRYWVTPLTVPCYLAGLSIGHLALCAVQFAILYAIGRFALGASISFAAFGPAFLLVLAAATFMAFGFLIASLAKTGNAGMAIANILNMPMMFLSALFFPVSNLPAFLRGIVYVNPLSYLADGLRASVGVESGVFPTSLVIGVPFAWIALSSAVSAWRLRWDVGR